MIATPRQSLSVSARADEFMEWLKDFSDKFLIWFLHSTSGFGKELTADGKKEQALWREQRLRNLQGLAQRSKQRFGDKNKPA